jgi:hypothetical protein
MTNKKKDLNYIASVEKAIEDKYGAESIQNPEANWNELKEKDYLNQLGEFYEKSDRLEHWQEKIDIDGVKISKKLLSRESLKNCPICGNILKKSMDDVCHVKFDCCHICYIKYVEDREERWLQGWRPHNK